jgi:DNA invertase Pin-like site-specific DNA recombinase
MLEQIAARKVGAVFAANISRLSRQLMDFESFRVLASYNQTLLVTDGRVIDPKDANDVVLTQISATFAQYENRKRAEIMSRSRMTKARQGIIVSGLPVGWVKGPDGKYDYDPRAQDVIKHVIEVFRNLRVLRRTVVALRQEGVKIPVKHAGQIIWNEPSLLNVKSILTNPSYAGVYTYGKTKCSPELGIRSNGEAVRVRVSDDSVVRIFNALPPYISVDEQEKIRAILKSNDFIKRDRPGRGSALCQGLLYCASCNTRFLVQYSDYSDKRHRYWCGWKTIKHGQKACSSCDGTAVDRAVEREVFRILRMPAMELLREALKESRRQTDARDSWIKTERQRLEHEEKKSLELLDKSRGNHPRLYAYAQDKMEKLLQAKEDFEIKIAAELAQSKTVPEEEELEELCALATDVPNLWHHRLVTHQERKEIVRCLIEKIVMTESKQTVEGMICWKSGHQTPIKIWRQTGRHNLIRELHAEGHTVEEIHVHLKRGQTSTGQSWIVNKLALYHILKSLGLKPNRRPKWYESLQKEAAELNEKGYSMRRIADEFNRRGLKSIWGKAWTKKLVFSLISNVPRKAYSLQNVHREVIAEARRRGLSYTEMAREFNETRVPRQTNRPWTAKAITERWYEVKSLEAEEARATMPGVKR